MTKKILWILLVSLSSLNGFSQLYSTGNGYGFSHHCTIWVNFELIPVTLTSFNAECSGNRIAVRWSVESVAPGDTFYVERCTDASAFTTIGFLAVSDLSFMARDFYFDDKDPGPGRFFYRLRITEPKGGTQFSSVCVINCRSTPAPRLAPNPTSGIVRIYPAARIISLVITNAAGQAVFYGPEGNGQVIDLRYLPAGLYFASIRTPQSISVHQLVILPH